VSPSRSPPDHDDDRLQEREVGPVELVGRYLQHHFSERHVRGRRRNRLVCINQIVPDVGNRDHVGTETHGGRVAFEPSIERRGENLLVSLSHARALGIKVMVGSTE
jgi:hypothetical protein